MGNRDLDWQHPNEWAGGKTQLSEMTGEKNVKKNNNVHDDLPM